MTRTITAILCVLSVGPALARAQPSEERDTATARALFREGLELSDLGDLQGAADRFRRSLQIRPSPVVEYNLGSTLVELGRLVEASEHLTHILQPFGEHPNAGQHVHDAARALQARIAPRIARLTIEVTGLSERDEVQLDGVRHPEQALGVGAPVDPGVHRITVHRDGTEIASTEMDMADGANESAILEVPPVIRTSVGPVGSETLEQPDPVERGPLLVEQDTDVLESPWFWVTVGSGVVAVAVLIVVLSMTGQAEAPFQGSLTPGVLEL